MNNQTMRLLSPKVLDLVQMLYQNKQIDTTQKNELTKKLQKGISCETIQDRIELRKALQELQQQVGAPFKPSVRTIAEKLL